MTSWKKLVMPYRHIEFQAGEYYHIYHRGHDRQKIFFENENYLHFLRLLNKYREKFFTTAKEHEDFVAKYGTDEDDDLEKFLFSSK